jgi:hypothetical protein
MYLKKDFCRNPKILVIPLILEMEKTKVKKSSKPVSNIGAFWSQKRL